MIIQAPETLANQQGVPGASDAILATERDPGTHPADEEVSGQPGAVSLGGSSDGSNALPPLP